MEELDTGSEPLVEEGAGAPLAADGDAEGPDSIVHPTRGRIVLTISTADPLLPDMDVELTVEGVAREAGCSPCTSTGRLSMSMTSFSGRRRPPIAFSRHPASRWSPSRSTSMPSFADHAATRRDSVGCEGSRPSFPSGAVPARSLVASRSAGSSRSAVASL